MRAHTEVESVSPFSDQNPQIALKIVSLETQPAKGKRLAGKA
jgi:hypothetical protein